MIETTLYNIFGEMPAHRLQKCRILYHLARVVKAPGCIIDLGVWHGYSAIAMAFGSLDNNTRRTVYGIDDYFPKQGWAGEPYGPDDLEKFREFKAAAQYIAAERVTDLILPLALLQGTALSIADLWTKASTQKAALFHWDLGADNTLHATLKVWIPHIAVGGLLAIHDTGDYRFGAPQYIKDLMENDHWSEYRELPGGLHVVKKT